MKKFNYRAMKSDGNKIEGIHEANTRDEVVEMITANGYYPLKIEEIAGSKEIGSLNFNNKVTTKDLAVFCRQMFTMLNAGVSITNALEMMEAQCTSKKLKMILGEICEDVKKGKMFSECMRNYPKDFPKLLISMVQSGEATGNMDEIMLRMATHFEKENKINNKVKSAMIYPIVLAIVAVVAIMAIMIFVMPTFRQIFDSEDLVMPGITVALLALSDFMRENIVIILIVIAGLVVGINMFRKTAKGYDFFSRFKLKLPVIGDLNRKIITSRFTRTMSTLLSSGISLIEALPIVTEVLGNKVAEEEMNSIREKVVKGEGLSEPIRMATVFPEMLSSMIKIGEESGSLDDILNKTADFYDEEVDQAITTATSLIEPALIIVMGGAIGVLVIAIMLPMFDMYQQLS